MIARGFDLRHTIESGQPLAFYSRYSEKGGVETVGYVTGKGHVEVSYAKRSGSIRYAFSRAYDDGTAAEEVRCRLGLKYDIREVYSHINTDRFMSDAIERFRGMRITKSDPWEAALCFVISQFNNIKRIRRIVGSMINEFGEEVDGMRLFPGPEAVAAADVGAIRKCGTGFRDRYIKGIAEQFAYSFNAEKLYGMDYNSAKDALLELDGVGDKVADCILLFGYGKMEAFPVDTWVRRVVEKVYFKGGKRSVDAIHEFADRSWAGYQGYAQQYIFWKGRESNIG